MSRYQSKWIRTAFVFSFIGVTALFFSGNISAQIDQAPFRELSAVVPPPPPPPVPPIPPVPPVPPVPPPQNIIIIIGGRVEILRARIANASTILANALNRRLDNFGLGATINNPILPISITRNRGRLTFNIRIRVIVIRRIMWADPVIAVGYDYFIDHGPSVKDIELPKGIGDNRYNLWIFSPELNDFKDSGVELIGGEKYTFEKPIRKFSIRGIEVDAELDPENQRAFPTGLSFDKTGKVSMRMVPITVDTDKE